jgi:hypothetical protein
MPRAFVVVEVVSFRCSRSRLRLLLLGLSSVVTVELVFLCCWWCVFLCCSWGRIGIAGCNLESAKGRKNIVKQIYEILLGNFWKYCLANFLKTMLYDEFGCHSSWNTILIPMHYGSRGDEVVVVSATDNRTPRSVTGTGLCYKWMVFKKFAKQYFQKLPNNIS